MPALTSRPLRVFLCHSSGDKPMVRELYQKLSAEGWMDVWLDEEKLLPGQDWDYEIEKALDNSDAVIVTLSNDSISKEGYVQKELRFVLEIALEKPEGTIFILPVRFEDCERPRRLRSIQGIDYYPPDRWESAYARMLLSLGMRAKHLSLLPDEPKEFSPLVGMASLSPTAPISLAGLPSEATETKAVWHFGRLVVILILLAVPVAVWPALPSPEFWGLLLITMARLFTASPAIVRLERLVAGLAGIFALVWLINGLISVLSDIWYYWFMFIGTDLAIINILFELRSSMQRRQRIPLWALLLTGSTIIPQLIVLAPSLRNWLSTSVQELLELLKLG